MLWLVAPQFDQVLDCVYEYQRFLNDLRTAKQTRTVDPRMWNQEGRMYLTGKPDKHRIMDLLVPLGVIGSFLFHKCPSSTMTASPLISARNRNNRMEARYQNHHGFSAEFDELYRVTKDKVLEVTKEVKDLIGASDTALAINKEDYVNMMQMFNVDPGESSRKFDHAVRSLGGGPGGRCSGQKRRRDDDSPSCRFRKRMRFTMSTSPPLPSDLEEESDDHDDRREGDDSTMEEPKPGPSSGPTQ